MTRYRNITFKKMKTPNIKNEKFMENRKNFHDNVSEDAKFTSNSMLHYFLKALVMCICLLGCMWQIASIIKLYFAYPTTVFVNVQNMEKLQLPGITLCNNNRLMMSKLKDYDPKFESKWATILSTKTSNTSDSDMKLEKQSLIDETLRNMLDELPVSKFIEFGHTADDFLVTDFFKCAADRLHPDKPCKDYRGVITTSQDVGNCFTLFHRSKSEVLRNIAIDSGLSQSPVKRGKHNESVNIEQSIEPFHPNEVLRLKVDFHSEEYTTLNEPVLGHVIIHDFKDIPVVREKSFLIQPGHYYEFFISKQKEILLPLPYASDCIDYNASKSDGSNDFNEYLHNPLSRENCVIGCMAQKTIDKCDCWPPELPFIKGTVNDSQENKIKWCDWDSKFSNKSVKPENMTWFRFCFSANENGCNKKCKADCSVDRYLVNSQARPWPQTERIEHSKMKDFLLEMRACCAIVSIRYWNSEININKYEPKFEIAEFTSYIGGLLSMWLGFSLLGSYDAFKVMVSYISRYLAEERKRMSLELNLAVGQTNKVHDLMSVYHDRQNMDQFRRNDWRKKPRISAKIIEKSRTRPSDLALISITDLNQ